MTFLLNLCWTLTATCLVVFAVLKLSGAAPDVLEEGFLTGLIVFGMAWICLALRESSGSSLPLILYPFLLGLVLGGPRLLGRIRRGTEDTQIKRRKNWRCASCGKENESIARVCYFCQAWRAES